MTASVRPELIPLVGTSVVTGIQTRQPQTARNMITLSIQIKGAVPAVTLSDISWMFAPNGTSPSVNLTESSKIKLSLSNDIASLTITRIELSDKGVYTAVVDHPAGPVMAPGIILDVQGKSERYTVGPVLIARFF